MYLLLFLSALPLLRVDSFTLVCSAKFGHHFSNPKQPDPRSSASSVSTLRFSSSAAVAQSPVVENAAQQRQQVATKPLGLITFDLDDSLYAIQPVLEDANQVFVEKMGHYGYEITQAEINEAGKKIRQEAGVLGTAMSHTEVRLEAIRREMERKMLERKLLECAEDWATEVESLTAPIRESAVRWAHNCVTGSIVESIYSAWERERHHSAERKLYSDVIPALQQIKEDHPDCIIGAVTDGKANPLLMVFTLAPYFDFCMSWEDDAANRIEFFKELGNVDGNADLQWIYRAAYEKFLDIRANKKGMKRDVKDCDGLEPVWIHVGDDLAYDVGGSASCGARTILLDLDEDYGQTAKTRFGPNSSPVSWNTASTEEIVNREAMNRAAESRVDKTISRLSMLPDAVNEILQGE